MTSKVKGQGQIHSDLQQLTKGQTVGTSDPHMNTGHQNYGSKHVHLTLSPSKTISHIGPIFIFTIRFNIFTFIFIHKVFYGVFTTILLRVFIEKSLALVQRHLSLEICVNVWLMEAFHDGCGRGAIAVGQRGRMAQKERALAVGVGAGHAPARCVPLLQLEIQQHEHQHQQNHHQRADHCQRDHVLALNVSQQL